MARLDYREREVSFSFTRTHVILFNKYLKSYDRRAVSPGVEPHYQILVSSRHSFGVVRSPL
jgi:hypothetical protein